MNHRRQLLLALGSGALTTPLAALAQQPGRTWRIGSAYIAPSATTRPFEESFLAGLRELGFEVGRNLVYDVRNCDGDPARLPAMLDELLALKPDLLVGIEQVARVMKSKTTTIPIVLTVSSDPVSAGLVKSLRQPGGNVTGNSSLDGPMLVKQVELFTELLPRMTSIAMLLDPGIPAADSIEAERCGRRPRPSASHCSSTACLIARRWSAPSSPWSASARRRCWRACSRD